MLDILFYVFVGVVAIQTFYYIVIFGKFSFAKPQVPTVKRIPVSVIVCCKNEAEKAKIFIPLLLEQNYPDFELVLINNASTDETLDIFEAYEKQYANIKIVNVENNEAFWGNKKFALTLGIKAARKEYLLFMDADCIPASKDWIAQMSSQFTLSKTIILGYSKYEKVKNSFLNKIIRFDALLSATQYFSWAKAGSPYTGSGKNMAYKKEEFFKVNGFIDHMNIRMGEDALFLNQAATGKNTTICYTPESFINKKTKKSFSQWYKHKAEQHYITSHFKFSDKFKTGLFSVSQILFLTLAILLPVLQFNWLLVVPVIVFRYIISWVSIGYSAGKLNEKDVMYWYPFLEIFLIFTTINITIKSLFSKPVNWK